VNPARSLLPPLLLFCALLAIAGSTANAAVLQLQTGQDHYPLGRFIDILEDPGGELSFDQVRSPPWSDRFKPSTDDEPNFGMTRSVYWVRLRLQNLSDYHGNWWLQQGYPNTQYLSVYLPGPQGDGVEVRDTGMLLPFATRDLAYHLLIFDLPPIPAGGETLYLRFENGSNMVISLSLWQPSALVERSWHQRLWQGFFLGCLLIMAAYNGFLWLSLRDPTYLWHLLFILGVSIAQATSDGLGAQYLWPDTPLINAYAIQGSALFGFVCLIGFSMRFLDTRHQVPLLHRLLQAVFAAWLLLALLLPWVSYGFGVRIAFALILLTSLSVLISSLVTLLRGYSPARYFFFGGLVLLLALIAMVLTRIGLLPSIPLTQFLGYQVGTLVFVLSLSFALADRIKLLEHERERAQRLALQTSAANQQLIEQQNVRLEELVSVRTHDLEQARDSAESANRAKSAFLATMSHELRTPLNAILGYARILQPQVDTDKARRGLQIITDSGDHLLTLLNDLLDLARVESGRLQLSRNDFALTPFLEALTAMFHIQAGDKGLRFSLQPGAGLPAAIHADERRLRQILINLVGNALKFTERGSVELCVSVHSRGAGRELVLLFEVRDSGPGIDTDQQQHIFAPFEQADAGHNSAQGSGLGLAVSARLVALMGGHLKVDSKPGHGSRFWFLLPSTEVSAPEHTAGTEADQQALPASLSADGDGVARQLLVVDDHAPNRQLLLALLDDSGLQLSEADSARQAQALLSEQMPDALLIDLVMPGMDGIELIRWVRAQPAGKTVPIIANSASAFEDDQRRALDAGADLFLPKPITHVGLFEALQRLLNERSSAAPGPCVPDVASLQQLHALLRSGDLDRFNQRLEQLAEDDASLQAFCRQLMELSHGYRLRELRQLLEAQLLAADS